jgi:hypothetical protein
MARDESVIELIDESRRTGSQDATFFSKCNATSRQRQLTAVLTQCCNNVNIAAERVERISHQLRSQSASPSAGAFSRSVSCLISRAETLKFAIHGKPIHLGANEEKTYETTLQSDLPYPSFYSCCGREARDHGIWASDESRMPVIPGDTGNSDPMRRCGSCSMEISSLRTATAPSSGEFTDYSDVVPDHISPRGMGGAGETIIRKTFRLSAGGAIGRKGLGGS